MQFISLKVEQRGEYFFRIFSFEKLETLCAVALDRNINCHQRREREKIYPGIKRPYVRNNPLLCCPFKSPLLICQCWQKEKRRGKGVLISSNLRQIGARRNDKYYFFPKKKQSPLFGKRKRKYFMMKTSPLSPVFGRPKILVAFSSFFPFFFMAARACVVSASISVLTSGGNPRFISGGGENLDLRTYTIYVPVFLLSTSCLEQRQYRVAQKTT